MVVRTSCPKRNTLIKALKMHRGQTQLMVYSYHVTRTLPFACPTANKFSGSDFGYQATHYSVYHKKYEQQITKERIRELKC